MPKNIIIAGAGFAGVWSALSAKRLVNLLEKTKDVNITVIAPQPALVMRPRLYESAPSTMFQSMEDLFVGAGINFLPGTVKEIHTGEHTVIIESTAGAEQSVQYDRLILAAGSSVNRPESIVGLRQHAFDVDSIGTATEFDTHLQSLSLLPVSAGRNHVVVCGAGFTGIELAADLPGRMAIEGAKVTLISDADAVAPDFGSEARSFIQQKLQDYGVESRLGHRVTAVDADGVTLSSGERIGAKTVVWTAGVKANRITEQVSAPRDSLGRLHVDEYLRVPSVDGVIASGDNACAVAEGQSHYALMSCQHALQLGRVSGHNAAAELLGEPLVRYSQTQYNCCLDIGPDAALIAGGWERDNVKSAGGLAKKVKRHINGTLIYLPKNPEEALALANPVGSGLDRGDELFAQLIGSFKAMP